MEASSYEGTIPFKHPLLTKPCSTWYKIYGNLKQSSTGKPLICLHGGPGACHNYLLPLQELAHEYGITIVLYDQIGCGNSTRLREKRLDHDFWSPDLFMRELENLLVHLEIAEYDLLGQSWGGMLGSQFAITRPDGLKKLILSNSPASMELWVASCNAWRAELPEEIEATLEKYENLRDYDNQDYKDAVLQFYQRHFCRKQGEGDVPFPEPVMETLKLLEEDDTVYYTMNGPSEFTVIGNLKTWSVVNEVHHINVPTLVINGEFDEARNICVSPFVEQIPGAVWEKIEGTSHNGHVEKTGLYCKIVADFLKTD